MLDKSVCMTNLDVAIYDLEDGVAPRETPQARAQLGELLTRPRGAGAPLRYMRINPVGSGAERIEADLALVGPGLDGIVVPKLDAPAQLEYVDAEIARREKASGVEAGTIRVIASIESARGLLNAPRIATASDRLIGLLFGAEDYALDLRLPYLREGEASDLLFARAWFANAAACGRVEAIDGIWTDLTDAQGLRRDALLGRQVGMTGKSLLHPGQIDPINAIFSPTAAELAHAQRVVAAFDEAAARGDGAVSFEGRFLDAPIVERARRTLALSTSRRP